MKADRLLFNAQFYPQFQSGEKNSGVSIVDPSGYVPAKERIENIMRAGERLDAYRRELYHYGSEDEDDESFNDPMMEPGLDLADVHRMRRDSLRKLASQAAARRDEDPKSEAKTDPTSDAAKPESGSSVKIESQSGSIPPAER